MPGSSGLTKICLNTSGVRRYFSIGKPGKASKIPHGICLSSLARKASGDPRSLISKPSKATRNVIDGSGGVVKGDRCPCATARRCRGMEIEAISAKSVSSSFRAGRGPAIVAVAAFILTTVYHMIEDRTTYQGPAAITLSAAAPTGKKHVGQTFGEPRLRSPSPPEPSICYHPRVCGVLRSGSFLCRFVRPIDPMAIGLMFC